MSESSLIGQTIDGRYEVKELIGRGGMAMVYRAAQPAMGRDVAIKVILPDVGSGPEFVQRFQQEAQIVARLEHPHILPVYDFGEYRGQAYLVMRLLEAGDLQDHIRRGMPSLQEATRLISQIASALTYAHQQGIIHRDLKPQNVLMDNGGNPYLTDFGIAKAIGATSQMTQTGALMGTPAYMAPEQWRTEPVDATTDVYALGIMAYVMLTGKMPFESETPFGLMYLHLDSMPDPLEVKRSDLPTNLTHVIFRAIAKRREERFPSAVAFGEMLQRAVNDSSQSFSVGDDFSTVLDDGGLLLRPPQDRFQPTWATQPRARSSPGTLILQPHWRRGAP
ncbi:MAG: serine/threonine protein kinase [Anaerolineae bacterium]|nr:serine/threonine protein kinase [Anaerolineae bacterium]